jgi:ketosteroid isomerase-like protein
MRERKTANGLDFEVLRHAIERCDLDLMLAFYAEDAELSVVNAGAPQGSPFELRGKAEIAKYLRAVFGQKTSHRVEREVVGRDRVTFQEACEYPDGGRVRVATKLELRDGKIVRQVDVVVQEAQADRKEETSKTHPDTHPGVETPPPDRLQMMSRLSSVGNNAGGLAVSSATASHRTALRRLVLLGTPLALALLEIFHPQPSGVGEHIEQEGGFLLPTSAYIFAPPHLVTLPGTQRGDQSPMWSLGVGLCSILYRDFRESSFHELR